GRPVGGGPDRIHRGCRRGAGRITLDQPECSHANHSIGPAFSHLSLKTIMLNRRQMIRRGALGMAALASSPRLFAQVVGKLRDPICGPIAILKAVQKSVAKSSPVLAPFVDPLRVPPALT